MNQYLLDTDVSINYLRGSVATTLKIMETGLVNCRLSEITVAELKYGAEKSNQPTAGRFVSCQVRNRTDFPGTRRFCI